jgi:hypothetical protein
MRERAAVRRDRNSVDVFITGARWMRERERKGQGNLKIRLVKSSERCSGASVKESKENVQSQSALKDDWR